MSKWNHAICQECWNSLNRGEPCRVREEFLDETAEPCCFCGKPQQSGIYVRKNPNEVPCKGEGVVHEETEA